MTDKYAVFGNPIAHSKSPAIHSAFAQQAQQDMSYTRQLVELGDFSNAANEFFNTGGRGLNITAPFKQDAYQFASQLTERAKLAGAVNTLIRQADDTILGDTTDGAGIVQDITGNHNWQISGKRLLILGAGGAVRGILEPLLEQQPQHIVIANRTIAKALSLSKDFAEMGYLCGCGLDMLDGQIFDLVINGMSAGLNNELPPLPDDLLAANANCYDMVYSDKPTVFMEWASQHGASNVADGLGMLVEQAACSFELWRGCRPDTAAVIEQLR